MCVFLASLCAHFNLLKLFILAIGDYLNIQAHSCIGGKNIGEDNRKAITLLDTYAKFVSLEEAKKHWKNYLIKTWFHGVLWLQDMLNMATYKEVEKCL